MSNPVFVESDTFNRLLGILDVEPSSDTECIQVLLDWRGERACPLKVFFEGNDFTKAIKYTEPLYSQLSSLVESLGFDSVCARQGMLISICQKNFVNGTFYFVPTQEQFELVLNVLELAKREQDG